jgi:hypothetical protein
MAHSGGCGSGILKCDGITDFHGEAVTFLLRRRESQRGVIAGGVLEVQLGSFWLLHGSLLSLSPPSPGEAPLLGLARRRTSEAPGPAHRHARRRCCAGCHRDHGASMAWPPSLSAAHDRVRRWTRRDGIWADRRARGFLPRRARLGRVGECVSGGSSTCHLMASARLRSSPGHSRGSK